MKRFLLLFFVIPLSVLAQGRVLTPLNPYYIADDTFIVTIDERPGAIIPIRDWMSFAEGFDKINFKEGIDTESIANLSLKRQTELRMFLVRDTATFDEIRHAMDDLLKVGFRPTTMRHVAALAADENIRNFNPGVVLFVSEQPYKGVSGTIVPIEGFFALGVLDERETMLFLAEPYMMSRLATKLVVLEPPK